MRYKHDISMINYAKPNQELSFVRYNREFAITVIVITEFDCMQKHSLLVRYLFILVSQNVDFLATVAEMTNQFKSKQIIFQRGDFMYHRFLKIAELAPKWSI